MNFVEGIQGHDPEINVIDKSVMTERTRIVFNQIASALQKSFGPMGSHAVISQAPYYHVTKDGFTIMKNIRYNAEYGYVDNVISGMISDICGRLNFAVGDGTTSAVLSANAMYNSFREGNEELRNRFFLPRNVLSRTKELTTEIIEELSKKAVNVQSMSDEDMIQTIRDIVYISSNANEEMTKIITDIYKEIKFPAINVSKSLDGNTRGKVISGFMIPARLADRIYVNNDNNTQEGTNYDIIIFDHKVGLSTFNCILQPLEAMSLSRGRKLICLAPMYDEVAINGDILNALNNEYRSRRDIGLVLMGLKTVTGHDKKRMHDLAMLCNTDVVTRSLENALLDAYQELATSGEGLDIEKLPINIDDRNIPGIRIKTPKDKFMAMENPQPTMVWSDDMEVSDREYILRVGFVGEASLSYNGNSIFREFRYDEGLYQKYLTEAENDLNEAVEKYKKMGTFNFEIDECTKRLLGLKMYMAEIEVGSSSEFAQGFIKDAMDDAVRAAESAYRNGIVVGGHNTLLRVITEMIDKKRLEHNEDDVLLLRIIRNAFANVRYATFENGFVNKEIFIDEISDQNPDEDRIIGNVDIMDLEHSFSKLIGIPVDLSEIKGWDNLKNLYLDFKSHLLNDHVNIPKTLFGLILEFEIFTGTCLNMDLHLVNGVKKISFNDKVINSMATDREILIATTDLVSLLTTSNQFVFGIGNNGY